MTLARQMQLLTLADRLEGRANDMFRREKQARAVKNKGAAKWFHEQGVKSMRIATLAALKVM